MKRLLIISCTIIFALNLNAQDRHFTQFYSAATYLNPALSGGFAGRYKMSTIYRDQWRSVLDKPIKTIGAALEVNVDMSKITHSRFKDKVGIGLSFYSDKISGVDLNTTQMALSLAYHKNLDQDHLHFMSIGFEGALGQKNINYENLTFHDQFDWKNGYIYESGEFFPQNNFSYFDIAVGLNYSFSPQRKAAYFVGGALHHVNSPQVSFFYNRDHEVQIGDNKLIRKITLHGGAIFPLSSQIKVSPRILLSKQGPHSELNVGTNFKLKLKHQEATSFIIGSWARITPQDDTQALESIILLVGLAIDHVQIGFSYDINLGHLTTYKQNQSVFELTFAYLGEYEDETVVCPKF